jgi:5-formyltetrahydrofolate cyclo-ligase
MARHYPDRLHIRTAVDENKASLRSRLLAERAGLTGEYRDAAGRSLRDAVLELPEVSTAGTVAAYYSVGAEPASRGLVYALWKRGTYVLLPVLREDRELDWASYEGPDSLTPGRFGLLEPSEVLRGVTAVSRADVVITPALACSPAGHRLGRGGGSYDRALARVGGQVLTLALLYDEELLPSVPVEEHDVPVRAIVRPGHGVTRLS